MHYSSVPHAARCEASVVGRVTEQVGAVAAAEAARAGRAVRSPGGDSRISFGVATGTASRATRGAAPSSAFGWRVVHGVPAVPPCRRCGGLAVLRTHGEAHSYTRGATVELTPQRGRESGQRTDRGAATLIRGACARCMAREMGPPRRGEDCAGAFTRGVQQSAGWCRHVARRHSGFASEGGPLPAGRLVSIVSHAPVAQLAEPVHVPLWVTTGGCGWVAGSSPAGRNFPFREVTK